MSRDPRKQYYNRDHDLDRHRPPIWGRSEFRPPNRRDLVRKGSRSRSPPLRSTGDKSGRSRSPRKNDKDLLDENILSEISKLPEPSELWENNQFQENSNFAASVGPPSFQSEAPPNTAYQADYQPQYSGIYEDFPPVASVPQSTMPPPDMASWNQMSLPPPPAPFINLEDQMKKEAAIETEMRHQKAALSKQREDYIRKSTILKKELDTLKDQRNELRGDSKRSPSPDTKRFLKENTKLQLEIQNKLKTINNVVDMLNGIIGEEAHERPDSDDSDHGSKRKSRSPSNKKFNYVYYDPEMHWCRVCNEFPPTAKDYLNHLHSPAHHKMAAAHMEAPWHSVAGINEGFPSFPSAPTKRTPIKGLQFFVPSTAWYCKLCDQFIGDLHCASAHLKSITHSKNYTNFVELNPHWETDWMSDRQKAFEKARASNKVKVEEKPQYTAHTITFHKDGFHTKSKEEPASPDKKRKKEKKKKSKRKKSSSSSDSDSSSDDSEPEKKRKKSKSKKIKNDPKEKALTEWMSSIQMDRLNDSDRKLLDNLKSRMKEKQDAKRRSEDRDSPDSRKNRESERRDVGSRDRRDDRDLRASRGRDLRESRQSRDRESRQSRERESRPRDSRDARDSRDSRDSRDLRDPRRRDDRPRSPPSADAKKLDIKKMPFIGKMPVYKHLGKKVEEKKEEQDQKKKEEDEASKKRREEMDAEIQKKVAEFKEKIAIAQKERAAGMELPPPGIALPTELGGRAGLLPLPSVSVPPTQPPTLATQPPAFLAPSPVTTPQAPANLPKDFQEALDIIFPTEQVKQEIAQAQQDLFGMGLPPFPMLPGFPPLGLMQPQMPQMPQMFGFDMFPARPQLYDAHVPIAPAPKPRARPKNKQDNKHQNNKPQTQPSSQQKPENGAVARKKEDLDDLAMLGIDASDVGAGI